MSNFKILDQNNQLVQDITNKYDAIAVNKFNNGTIDNDTFIDNDHTFELSDFNYSDTDSDTEVIKFIKCDSSSTGFMQPLAVSEYLYKNDEASEASTLPFANGMTIPLLTKLSNNTAGFTNIHSGLLTPFMTYSTNSISTYEKKLAIKCAYHKAYGSAIYVTTDGGTTSNVISVAPNFVDKTFSYTGAYGCILVVTGAGGGGGGGHIDWGQPDARNVGGAGGGGGATAIVYIDLKHPDLYDKWIYLCPGAGGSGGSSAVDSNVSGVGSEGDASTVRIGSTTGTDILSVPGGKGGSSYGNKTHDTGCPIPGDGGSATEISFNSSYITILQVIPGGQGGKGGKKGAGGGGASTAIDDTAASSGSGVGETHNVGETFTVPPYTDDFNYNYTGWYADMVVKSRGYGGVTYLYADSSWCAHGGGGGASLLNNSDNAYGKGGSGGSGTTYVIGYDVTNGGAGGNGVIHIISLFPKVYFTN